MCGICGIYKKDKQLMTAKDLQIFKELLILNKSRGEHSFGFAYYSISKKKMVVWKAEGSAVILKKNIIIPELENVINDSWGIIGHTRFATHGAKNEDNAHPFEIDNIAGVHNGVIRNYRTLLEDEKHPVDSYHLIKYFNVQFDLNNQLIEASYNNEKLNEIMQKPSGLFSVLLLNDKGLNIFRNGQTLEMVLFNKNIYAISSEFEHIREVYYSLNTLRKSQDLNLKNYIVGAIENSFTYKEWEEEPQSLYAKYYTGRFQSYYSDIYEDDFDFTTENKTKNIVGIKKQEQWRDEVNQKDEIFWMLEREFSKIIEQDKYINHSEEIYEFLIDLIYKHIHNFKVKSIYSLVEFLIKNELKKAYKEQPMTRAKIWECIKEIKAHIKQEQSKKVQPAYTLNFNSFE